MAPLLLDQATRDNYRCTCYSSRGWVRAYQSGTASMAGSSQAAGPQAGLIRGGPAGSPIWVD
jgi:hypothetical protein